MLVFLIAAALGLAISQPLPADDQPTCPSAPMAGRLATSDPPLRLEGAALWGQARASLLDRFQGTLRRRAAFLAAQEGGLRDVYVAWVRLDHACRPIGLEGLSNLTNTPDGDEMTLALRGQRLAYATRVGAYIPIITIVDLESGDRLIIALDEPVATVSLSWEDTDVLALTAGLEARINATARRIEPTNAPLRLLTQSYEEYDWLPRLVKIVREHPWVGPEKIAFLENVYFFLADVWERIAYRIAALPPNSTIPQSDAARMVVPTQTAAPSEITPEAPPDNPTAVTAKATALPQTAPQPSPTPTQAPPPQPADKRAAYLPPELGLPHYSVYPDPQRPFAKAEVITIDPSLFDLHLVAGTWEPRSTTGLVGTGMIPDDEETRRNLVAAFNGGWAAMHGAYGMMINRQIWLPPKNGIATLAWYADGRLRLGVWGKDILPSPDIVTFRQNCLPLIENGMINPELGKLSLWGLSVSDEAVIYRSGLGQTRDGKLLYVAGNHLSARTLAQVLHQAGAYNAMQLDIDDFHVVFITYRQVIGKDGKVQVVGTKLRQDMQGFEGMYLKPFALDFFYLTRKIARTAAMPSPAKPSPTPTPTMVTGIPLPPLPGRIAFQSSRHGNWEIYSINADGSSLRRLTDNPADDLYPAWSPDGHRLAFTSGRDGNWEIYVMQDDGSSPIRLTDHPASDWYPAWSPDGTRIAFQSDREGNAEIFVVDAFKGGPASRLTRFKGNNERPTWSPDGRRLAFDSDFLHYGKVSAGIDLYIMDLTGVITPTRVVGYAEYPAWSPDGRRLAFHAERAGNWDIYIVNIDGSGLVRVTTHPAADRYPAWSPDGRWLAFSSDRDGLWEVYITPADGGGPAYRLTYGGGLHPSWGPGRNP